MAVDNTELALEVATPDRVGPRRLTGHVIPQARVDAALADWLFHLWSRYYLHVDRAGFDRDQAEKDWVLLLRDGDGEVRGFTSMKHYEIEIQRRPVRAIFNGNTIIERDYWGEQELVASWCRFMATLLNERPGTPLYWFLICSGYRTYMYLPLFYHEFYPRHDCATPPFEQALIDGLGRMKFPDEYRDGVVRVAQPRECLVPELAVPATHKLQNPHIRFFVERNPGAARGDELVCLAEFSLENTRRLAQKMARETLFGRASMP